MSGDASSRAKALRKAKELGCTGAHQHPDGTWMPCESHEEMLKRQKQNGEKSVISRMQDFQSVRERKGRKKKRKNKKTWEKLRERGVTSIDTMPGGGLVSGAVAGKTVPQQSVKRKVSLHQELNGKALGRAISRAAPYNPNAVDGDNDGIVQDGTAFQRPAALKKVSKTVEKAKNWEELLEINPGMFEDAPREVQRNASPKVVEEFEGMRSATLRGQIGGNKRQVFEDALDQVGPEHRGKQGAEQTLYLVGGTAASGKTTLLENGTLDVPSSTEAAHLDPDEFKPKLDGFNGGAGTMKVHKASRMAMQQGLKKGLEQGMDAVVPGTGKSNGIFRRAKEVNPEIKVVGHFVYVPTDVATKRLKDRNAQSVANGGRVLPEFLIEDQVKGIQFNVPRQITRGEFDEFYLWNNNTKPPSLIAKRTSDGEFEIRDDEAFEDFFGSVGAGYVRSYWEQNQ